MERLIGIDQDITLWLNGFHSPWSDQLWMFLSDVRIWFPMYGVIMGVMIYRLGWKKGLAVILSKSAGMVTVELIIMALAIAVAALAWMVARRAFPKDEGLV